MFPWSSKFHQRSDLDSWLTGTTLDFLTAGKCSNVQKKAILALSQMMELFEAVVRRMTLAKVGGENTRCSFENCLTAVIVWLGAYVIGRVVLSSN